jgi:hypothetical protein
VEQLRNIVKAGLVDQACHQIHPILISQILMMDNAAEERVGMVDASIQANVVLCGVIVEVLENIVVGCSQPHACLKRVELEERV